MDLVELVGRQNLPMGSVVFAAIKTLLARNLAQKSKYQIINPWARGLFSKLDNLKFLGYIGNDDFPVILPAIQTQVQDGERVHFSLGAYGDELTAIPESVTMAVFGLTFSMEDVLLCGTYKGVSRVGGVRCGFVDIDWVYNSMPPVPQQIYPPKEIKTISAF